MNNPAVKSNTPGFSLVIGSAIWALLVFTIINLFLTWVQPLSVMNPDSLPSAHTWEWWRTQSYLKLTPPPAIVLLGSSLVMIPVSLIDADFLNEDIDPVRHYGSAYMQAQLRGKVGSETGCCFNFALPGLMVSDDYLIARALFTGHHRPKLMVLGLTLRDFSDSNLSCAAATPAFRYFKHFVPVDELLDLSMPEIWQRIDYWQGKLFYLWGRKLDIQSRLSCLMKNWIDRFGHSAGRLKPNNPFILGQNAPCVHGTVEPGAFMLKAHQVYPYRDNSGEYRGRFRRANLSLFRAQTVFLQKLLELARSAGMQVLLVNMPLTEGNRKLMPAGEYDRYMRVVTQASRRFGCPLVDLSRSRVFEPSDFKDTAHMNASGGRKFIDALAGAIKSDPRLVSILQPTVSTAVVSNRRRRCTY